jgi:hypothetical protein
VLVFFVQSVCGQQVRADDRLAVLVEADLAAAGLVPAVKSLVAAQWLESAKTWCDSSIVFKLRTEP